MYVLQNGERVYFLLRVPNALMNKSTPYFGVDGTGRIVMRVISGRQRNRA